MLHPFLLSLFKYAGPVPGFLFGASCAVRGSDVNIYVRYIVREEYYETELGVCVSFFRSLLRTRQYFEIRVTLIMANACFFFLNIGKYLAKIYFLKLGGYLPFELFLYFEGNP